MGQEGYWEMDGGMNGTYITDGTQREMGGQM